MDYKPFNLERFEFWDDSYWATKLSHFLLTTLVSLLKANPGIPPVVFKNKKEKWIQTLSLEVLGEAVGFDDPAMLKILNFHQRRRYSWVVLATSLYLVMTLCLFPLILEGWRYLASVVLPLNLNPSLTIVVAAIITVTIPMFTFVVFGAAFQLTSIITNRLFAETLCIVTVMYLVVELSRDDVLTRPDRRRALLARMDNLAQNTLLLSSRYSGRDDRNQDWAKDYFRNMSLYIRERERWVVAPTDTTLNSLRQDFCRLATIYITANYGDLTYPEKDAKLEMPTPTRKQLILASLPRFLGIFLPLALMGFLLWQPTRLEMVGVETNAITLIFIVWFLLAIDATLKLGIMDKVVGLAKQIREL